MRGRRCDALLLLLMPLALLCRIARLFTLRDAAADQILVHLLLAAVSCVAIIAAVACRARRTAQLGAICTAVSCALFLRAWNGGAPVPAPLHGVRPQCWRAEGATARSQQLTLLTITIGLPDSFTSCLHENRRAYARAHGLEYCTFSAALSALKSPSWQKMIAVNALLSDTGARREAVWYLDADALIINHSVALSDVLAQHPAKDVLFAVEPNSTDEHRFREAHNLSTRAPRKELLCRGRATSGPHVSQCIQGGSFIWRNTPWARRYLADVYAMSGSGAGGGSDRLEFIKWNAEHTADRARLAMLPNRVIDAERLSYRPGDFVLHFAGGKAGATTTFKNPSAARLISASTHEVLADLRWATGWPKPHAEPSRARVGRGAWGGMTRVCETRAWELKRDGSSAWTTLMGHVWERGWVASEVHRDRMMVAARRESASPSAARST